MIGTIRISVHVENPFVGTPFHVNNDIHMLSTRNYSSNSSNYSSNYTHYNVWDEITYPFLNFNGATVEV